MDHHLYFSYDERRRTKKGRPRGGSVTKKYNCLPVHAVPKERP